MVGPITNSNSNLTLQANTPQVSNTESTTSTTGMGSVGQGGAVPPPVVFVSNSDQSTGAPADPGIAANEMEAALEELRNNPALRDEILAALSSGGNAEDIAVLLIKMSGMSREELLDQRLQARAAARSDLEASAAESMEAATKQIVGAIVGAVLSAVSAVVSIGGAVSSVKSSGDALKASKDANQMEKIASTATRSGDSSAPKLTETAKNAAADAGEATAAAQRANQITMAVGQLGNAAGNMISGIMEGAAKMDEAEGKLREASAQDHQAHGDVTKKAMDDLEELVKSAIQFLKAMQSAEVDLMATLTRV